MKQDPAAVAARLESDPAYFIETFFYIINKDRERTPFILNPPQWDYYRERSNFDLILKARKEGFSSLIEALFLHACIFKKNARAVTMSHEWESTVRHFERVQYFLRTMGVGDIGFKFDLSKESERQLSFANTNSSYWIGTAGAKGFGRGDDITHLHVSEVAWIPDQATLTGVLEACVPDAVRVFETTANGSDLFHKLWKEAERRDMGDREVTSPWKRHFFAWFEDPTNQIQTTTAFYPNAEEKRLMDQYKLSKHQMAWWRAKRASMTDKALMPQEYPSSAEEAFLKSGRPAFNREKIQMKKMIALQNPVLPGLVGDVFDDGQKATFSANEEGPLRIWKAPFRGRQYLISADVSEGVSGGNWSVAQVIDRSSREQVAVYRIRMNPGAFGRKLVELALFYNNAVLIPENNNVGHATIEAIEATGYPHLLSTRELWGDKEPVKAGFPTTERHRNQIITALRVALDDDSFYFHDPLTLDEMDNFVQNEDTGKFEAQAGYEDDCVMSLAIGVYCLNFLTVDDTYASRLRHSADKALVVSSAVPRRRELARHR